MSTIALSHSEPQQKTKPPKKWDSSTLLDKWIYKSSNLVMIRLRVWELSQTEIECAIAPFFIGKDYSVRKISGSGSDYAHLLTTQENIPILKTSKFQIGTTILRKIPRYIPPSSVKYNVLVAIVPCWVTVGMLVPFFEKFNSDPTILVKNLINIYRNTDGTSKAIVTFSENIEYQNDSLMAAAMCTSIVVNDSTHSRSVMCSFKTVVSDYQKYYQETKDRENAYLKVVQEHDIEKYHREIARRR